MKPNLSPKQLDLLQKLAELLDFGGSVITSYNFNQKHRSRKSILIQMVAASHNYSEGIYILLKEARTNSAEALLRPLLENIINCAYIFNGKRFDNLKRFIAEDEFLLLELGPKIQNFLIEHPEVKNYDSEFFSEDWNAFVKNKVKQLKMIQGRRYGLLKRLPDLRERAKQVDLNFERLIKKPPKRRMEYLYLLLYWQLSCLEHLGSRGLNTFSVQDNKGNISINLSGEIDSLERIAIATYSFYYIILETFAKQFKLYDLRTFKTYKNRIRNIGSEFGI